MNCAHPVTVAPKNHTYDVTFIIYSATETMNLLKGK